MIDRYKLRRIIVVLLSLFALASVIVTNTPNQSAPSKPVEIKNTQNVSSMASQELDKLAIKGRTPKTNYSREQFGASWSVDKGCDTRNIILIVI